MSELNIKQKNIVISLINNRISGLHRSKFKYRMNERKEINEEIQELLDILRVLLKE